MSFDAVRSQVETFFNSAWSTTEIEFENVKLQTAALTSYVSIFIREGQSIQASLGANGTYNVPGVVMVQVFIKRDIGTKAAKDLADAVANIFRGKQTADVRFQIPYGAVVPNSSDWFQYNVVIPFYAYFDI